MSIELSACAADAFNLIGRHERGSTETSSAPGPLLGEACGSSDLIADTTQNHRDLKVSR
jgi:hypothetical protein